MLHLGVDKIKHRLSCTELGLIMKLVESSECKRAEAKLDCARGEKQREWACQGIAQ